MKMGHENSQKSKTNFISFQITVIGEGINASAKVNPSILTNRSSVGERKVAAFDLTKLFEDHAENENRIRGRRFRHFVS